MHVALIIWHTYQADGNKMENDKMHAQTVGWSLSRFPDHTVHNGDDRCE